MVRIKTVLNFLTYGIALLGFVPLFPYLETFPRIVFPAALVSGVMADRKMFTIPPWISTVISILFFVFYTAQFTRDNLVGPAVNLLVILLSVRLFSDKIGRNYLQIFALSLFSFTSSSLFSLSPVFLVYLSLILVLIAVSLVILTFYSTSSETLVSPRGLTRIMSVALLMPVASVPLMLLLFIILPRTQVPLWNFLNVGGAHVTGLSEKVEPGSASAVGDVKNIAFRAGCEKMPKDRLYWRGIVLNTFEGNAWVRKETPPGEEGAMIKGRTVRQTIYPEPGRAVYLVALNVPREITGARFSASHDYTYTARGGGIGRIRYDVSSVLSDTIETRKGIGREFYLRVPERLSRRMVDLGKSIADKGKDGEERISLLESEFRARNLTYATSNLPVGEFPLDMFLFEKRRGHCEFFASTFAVLLRLAGVPARLVGGFLGGEYNDLGGYYVVTDDMAHVWVEAYIEGKGWLMIDPSRWAVNFPGARESGHGGVVQRLQMALDAFGYYWNVAVLNYDLERQLRLINSANLGLRGLSLHALLKLTIYLAIFPCLAVIAAVLMKRRTRSSREERIVARFLRKVAKEYRIGISPETGLHELSATLNNPDAARFVAIYGPAVYHDRRLEPDEIRELNVCIRKMTGPKSRGHS